MPLVVLVGVTRLGPVLVAWFGWSILARVHTWIVGSNSRGRRELPSG